MSNHGDEKSKKKRSPNFTGREKSALLNLIYTFKSIIENKTTDAVTWREKEDAWVKITSLFNAQAPEGILRAKESLKKYYDNLKKNTRKEVAQEKIEIKKTGGGPEMILTDSSSDIILDIINPKTVYGLPNTFDSDSLPPRNHLSDHSYTDDTILAEESSCRNNEALLVESPVVMEVSDSAILLDKEVMEHGFSTPRLSMRNENQENVNTTNFSSNKLRKPISEPLQHKWSKRRRPNIQQLNSTQLSEEYLKLAKIKQEFYENEKEMTTRRRGREEELFEIQKKILLTELETKETELRKLKLNM